MQDSSATNQMSTDTPMDSPEKLEKGKGKMAAEQDPMEDDEDESEEDEEVGFAYTRDNRTDS